MIEAEDDHETFPHPHNWTELSTEVKAELLVISNQLKIISVADFSSHFFKETSSLSKRVEKELNKDSRLDINNPTETRPPIDTVLEEIKRTRSKHNKHQNNQEDAYKKKSSEDCPLLGIITNSETQELSLKGKPISFKSRSKGSVDITIHNPEEFSNFVYQGGFQRQHISSLVCQCFDPTFTFNALYHATWLGWLLEKL